ncbi:hypothetical protein HEK616_32740 [Streptomyces nigrescens]|uniref:Secreted protein n=2 Tax=Streptomyces TaxID=1883 RepID=A0ABM7ZTY9_STRNI|nr:hypothetical protein [Streptomyces nigrescens]MEE4417884.1 hypothetical protein [Streptomyces sp. DSM 41528]BDM69787.1 hypothetical protein HEK616_32740 [Streptomyces nigrescens]
MTRTKKTGLKARGGRVAVVGALGLASVTLAAVPAFAKGSVDITAPHTANVGKTFTVTAHGDDDAASYLQICLEGRSAGKAWHRVTCGAVVDTGTEAKATAHVKATQRGILEYRAIVYGLTSPNDHHPVRERTSGPVKVNVR